VRTRVRFKDGTEVIRTWREPNSWPDSWPDGTPKVAGTLSLAIELAEHDRGGEAHDGAWLEFSTSGGQS